MNWTRVLSYPPRHHYVDRLHGRTARLVHRDEAMPGMPRFLDPAWVTEHALDFDVAHLHLARFHPEHQGLTVEGLTAVVRAHRRAGVAVVVTVHDLALPTWPQEDLKLIDLLQAIDEDVAAVLTLTRSCADRLEQLLGRPVRVVPYGPLLDTTERHRLRSHRRLTEPDAGPLLLHAGRLESRLAWEETIQAVIASTTGARLRILVQDDRAEQVRAVADGHPRIVVESAPSFSMPTLARAMADARAVVLPYRWATHSATLELATDVGTPVIAADVGHLAEQQPVVGVPCTDGILDVAALTAIVDGHIHPGPAVREVDRERDHHALESHHSRLYTQLSLGRLELESVIDLPEDDARDLPEDLRVDDDRVGVD